MNLNDYYLIEQGGKDRYQQLLREADEERRFKGINSPSYLAEVLLRIRFALFLMSLLMIFYPFLKWNFCC